MLTWEKLSEKGYLPFSDMKPEWMSSHATLPLFLELKDRYRIFFSTRNEFGKSLPAYVDIDKLIQHEIGRSEKPLLCLGDRGSFDHEGIMFSSFIILKEVMYMYYIGWNTETSVPYKVSIGLAISNDYGITFEKISNGPLMDRSLYDPIFVTTPFVFISGEQYIMYYASCTKWLEISGKMEPVYGIKRAFSKDGINWEKENKFCIEQNLENEAICRPWIIRTDENFFRMFYSYRKTKDYRSSIASSYRIGTAISYDGDIWYRDDTNVGLDISLDGWDSQMICYASFFTRAERLYMLYNGNGFGTTGFGCAVFKEQ